MNRFGRILFGLLALAVFGLLLWRPWEGTLPPIGPAGPGGAAPQGGASPREGAPDPSHRKPIAADPAPLRAARAGKSLVVGRLLFRGRPAAGARVEWLVLVPGVKRFTATAARGETGESGRFQLAVPPEEEGILLAWREDLPRLVRPGIPALRRGEALDLGDLVFPDPLALEVQVLDKREGTPLAGAAIRALPPGTVPGEPGEREIRAETGPDGKARLFPLAQGNWRLLARAEGYSPYRRHLVLPRDEEAPLVLYLDRGPGLSGRVTGPGGRPVPGALVSFEPLSRGEEDHRAGGSLRAGPSGDFRIAGLQEGDWSLYARAPGRALPRPVKASCPSPRPVNLVLRPLPTVSGKVLGPKGRPPRRGKAALSRKRTFGGAWILSPLARPVDLDGRGRFRIVLDRFPPPESRWVVVAWAPGLPPAGGKEFFFEKGRGPRDLAVRLPAPVRVRGRVRPARGAQVILEASSSLPFPPFLPFQERRTARPDEEGCFVLGPVTPGSRTLRIEAPGFTSETRTFLALPGKTLDLGVVSLQPGVVVGGILLGPSGRPEPGGLVWLRPTSGGTPRRTVAGRDGRFRFEPVPPGRYFLQACRRGADPMTTLEDYAATRRLLVLSGRETWIPEPITLKEKRRTR